jgi:hypothetical protein
MSETGIGINTIREVPVMKCQIFNLLAESKCSCCIRIGDSNVYGFWKEFNKKYLDILCGAIAY